MNKNYAGWDSDPIKLPVYEGFNFSRPNCRWHGGEPRGHRLFPGDDTPRTFIGCNMVNVEPPPGSTLIDCLTAIREMVPNGLTDSDTDRPSHDAKIYGKIDPDDLTVKKFPQTRILRDG